VDIKTIEYRKLISTGDYSNLTIGATAAVGDDDTPDEALVALQAWVENQLRERTVSAQETHDARQHLYELQRQAADTSNELRRMKARYDEGRRLLEKHGIEMQTTAVFDPPF